MLSPEDRARVPLLSDWASRTTGLGDAQDPVASTRNPAEPMRFSVPLTPRSVPAREDSRTGKPGPILGVGTSACKAPDSV